MPTSDDLRDVVGFLGDTLPFSALPEDSRLDVARRLTVDYIPRRHNRSLDPERRLYIVRTGAFELRGQSGELIDRLGEHELFGINTLLSGNRAGLTIHPIEDALVFTLAQADFEQLCERYAPMHQYFNQVGNQRERQNRLLADRSPPNFEHRLTQRVREFTGRAPVSCPGDTSIQRAAGIMREHRVSSLLLMADDRLEGIVTDRDIRNRAVAEGLDLQRPVRDIATAKPTVIDADALLFDAQRLMGQHRIHHLPVLERGRPVGLITATDLVRAQQVSPLYLINDILRQTDPEALADLRHRVSALIHNWVQADIGAYEMGRILAAIGDAFVQQCLTLARRELGEAPLAFAWLAFGSQARMDQTFASDQDNALILSRAPDEAEADYFQRLADRVCQMLDRCGYRLCPGDIMASNPRWRRTPDQWRALFDDWIERPTPEALLNSSIFFDLRVVEGDASLLPPVQKRLLDRAPHSDLFLAMLTRAALRNRPPLGFFRRFVVTSGGEHDDELDIKHRGVALVNDLARIYALAAGSGAVNTPERLEAAMAAGVLVPAVGHSLRDAWNLLAHLRMAEQSQAVRQGREPTRYLDPDTLSPLMRAHLKDAFGAIKRAQQAALQQFARGQHG